MHENPFMSIKPRLSNFSACESLMFRWNDENAHQKLVKHSSGIFQTKHCSKSDFSFVQSTNDCYRIDPQLRFLLVFFQSPPRQRSLSLSLYSLIFCAATKTFDIFRISQKTVIVCNFVLATFKLVSRNWSKKIHKILFTLNNSINTVWVVKLSTSSRDFLSVYLVDCLKATLLASKSQSSVVFIT